ncbi:uncharacterized protein [Epargyreus clarus]|uniref:uncharacterized protein isoform X2 n=1 Tax=Epargyreus clarus TaxID=520877 RepID=UPI003C2B6C61
MSGRAVKFFVWGGGRWREVSPGGRVAGWGRARFAAARGGRLQRARRGAVLRGLRALAAGRPRSVQDGPPLSQIRLNDPEVMKWRGDERERSRCEHCCRHRQPALPSGHLSKMDTVFDRLLKTTVSASTQCGAVDAATQVSARDDTPPLPRKPTPDPPVRNRTRHKNNFKQQEHKSSNGHTSNTLKRKRSNSPKREQTAKRSRRISPPAACPRAEESEEVPCKELIIEEEDVVLLRTFIERSKRLPFEMDLQRFDEDDSYKQRVFFRLNPIVNIVRSRRMERLLREERNRSREVSLKDFASVLGLQSVTERSSQASDRRRRSLRKRDKNNRSVVVVDLVSDTDKENESDHKSRKVVKRRKVLKEQDRNDTRNKVNGDVTEAEKRVMKTDTVNRKDASRQRSRPEGASAGDVGRAPTGERESSKPRVKKVSKPAPTNQNNNREYSALEDAAIVRWVSTGGRARLVNGNRLWQELQPLHRDNTGHCELKSRKLYPRALSTESEPQLQSAWSRRPRPPPSPSSPSPSPPLPSPSKSRRLRPRPSSPPVHSPSKSRRLRPPPSPPSLSPPVHSPSKSRRPRPPPSRSSPSPSPPLLSPSKSRSRSPSSRSSSDTSLSSRPSSDGVSPRRQLRSNILSPMKRSMKSRPARLLRSSGTGSRPAGPARPVRHVTHTPTYSELTRRYARDSGASAAGSDSAPPAPPRPGGRRLYNPKDAL